MNQKAKSLIFLFCVLLAVNSFGQEKNIAQSIADKTYNPAMLLWYKAPAAKWDEALPVGNGRLGAMVFGKSQEEIIQFNEDTYWTGGPYSTVVKDGYKTLPEIQRLVFNGDMLKAHNLFGRTLMGYPVEQQKYQSLANLHLFFNQEKNVTGYKRWLDLETGITAVEYQSGDVLYKREVFSSAPGQVIVIRLTADKPRSISFKANLQGVRNQTHSDYATDYFKMDGFSTNGLILTGKSADYLGVEGKLRYEARIKAITKGGHMQVDDKNLIIEKADEVILYFTAATNFVNFKDVSADQHARVEACLENIAVKSYETIREEHLIDYKKLFDRTSLYLPSTTSSFLPTNERMESNINASDPSLAALAYHFGRYVLISSSRPGTQAANLQGIWNNDMNPMWDAKYTTNINTQMNYWAVESANLPECVEPLTRLVTELTDQGTAVAREHYGCSGWVCHQNTDLWRVAAPMDGPTWGTFTTGGAWLCTHLWEHYLFTRDTTYLRLVYPVMKGAVRFFMDFLVPHPNGKWLVTNPSTSPENFPASKDNGPYFDEVTGSVLPGTTICAGSSIDMQLLTDLFGYYTQAATLLSTDTLFAGKVNMARNKLAPPQIGKDGGLQEWADDWGQLEKEHRHASHLYGLYPGNVLSVKKTPGLIEACKVVLNQRGDGASGWSRAWKTAIWARLKDGNHAYKIFKGYLKEQACTQLFAKCGAPMQVDGTLGMTAAITEMLLQSQEDVIELLPALPNEWSQGELKGVCARGAFELNMKWENSRIVYTEIFSKQGSVCRIDPKVTVKVTCNGKKVAVKKLKEGGLEFMTLKGNRYMLNAQPTDVR